jgi:glycogen operon protein
VPWARSVGVFLNGEEIVGRDATGGRVVGARLLVLLNAWWEDLGFTLPGEPLGGRWTTVLDTREETGDGGSATHAAGERVTVGGRSLLVLERAA